MKVKLLKKVRKNLCITYNKIDDEYRLYKKCKNELKCSYWDPVCYGTLRQVLINAHKIIRDKLSDRSEKIILW